MPKNSTILQLKTLKPWENQGSLMYSQQIAQVICFLVICEREKKLLTFVGKTATV